MKKPLIIIAGPTAVGKTGISIKLAKELNGEIISADSMQVYKGMDIGTAKIKPEEMQGIKHYMIDEYEPDFDFNVVIFKNKVKGYIDEIHSKGKIPILVGGTGFYIQSVLYDIDFSENSDNTAIREKLTKLAEEKGNKYLHDYLFTIDEESAKAIHPNNTKRVIRAIEYYELTGEKISEHNEEQRKNEAYYDARFFVLNDKRERLYENIDKRIDIMLDEGLIDEVKTLYKKGYNKDYVSMQGLGYKEIIDYLEGRCTLEEAVYILKRDTRHFAKRQLTWFRREKDIIYVNKWEFSYNEDKILDYMMSNINF
ncbi:MAG: tRNA (adenosine(37)-N6)-dimethylallyltransferase MiaA [Lachnospiraceae bacterium]|nr:tRNA (adenosine(37)-N6)-dimethylallyltransferase MiaA [Lachnospiraceae bacterium]